MQSHFDNRVLRHVAAGSGMTVLDVAGLTVEFLTGPQDTAREFSVMRGIIPPGGRQRAALEPLPVVLPLSRRLQALFSARAADLPARPGTCSCSRLAGSSRGTARD
jgi:hypothetical protein